MSDKNHLLVETAFRRFAHYGIKKTSMAEIAKDAGVSRQTLYNAFKNKEDLLFAAMLGYANSAHDGIVSGCGKDIGLEARLDVLFDLLVQKPFDAMQLAPHIDEIVQASEQFDETQKTLVEEIYYAGIREALAPYSAQIQAAGLELMPLVVFIKSSFRQIKSEAENSAQLVEMFQPLRLLLLNTLRSD